MNDTRVRAPELQPNLGWLNTDRPLRFSEELKGRVVLLDFWTYCCINCMHVLPELAWLEEKYKDRPFAVIGVHSAKFTNESERRHIRSAILRYEIKHPVVVDDRMRIWQAFGVRSWPSLVLVDPEGYVAGGVSGEGHRDVLDRAIGKLLEEHRQKGTLAARPLDSSLETLVPRATGLAFPGKVLATGKPGSGNENLFIADSNHNRIVIATQPDDSGRCTLIRVVGDGKTGNVDGPAEKARFNHPQGLALYKNRLLVADTENHTIRRVDLGTFEVTTLTGTGEISRDRSGGKNGTHQGLNSPWDLLVRDDTLYIAMAGLHQLWKMNLKTERVEGFAGSGREDIIDGPLQYAALAQPSGLCLLGNTLYFADSEVSGVRGVDLAGEEVFTIVGKGLFVFGDADGPPEKARLQHCLGVTAYQEDLLVADTYNHKIKRISPSTRITRTLYGTGRAGTKTDDGDLQLYEPGGLCVLGDVLFVADTNNHRIVRVDLRTRRWNDVTIEGLARSGTEEPVAAQSR